MTGAHRCDDSPDGPDLTGFVQAWARAVIGTSFVPMSRAEIEAYLHSLAGRLVAALHAEPFSAVPGYHVGTDLVATGFAAPEALARTVTVVNTYLPALPHTGSRGRLADLVEALIAGHVRKLRSRTLDEQEAIRRAALVAREAAEQSLRDSEARLRHAALHDSLTGLPNRTSFAAQLDEVIAHSPHDALVGVCFIGLDGFTAVNDSLGHQVGDELLTIVADRLRALATEAASMAARLSGDEFALLVTGAGQAAKVADRALAVLAVPAQVGDHDLSLSASVGVVERPAGVADAAELVRAADLTLRWAKADGKNRWTVFDPDRNARQLARYRLSAAMPAALERDEFTLLYQPLTDLHTGALRGVEALARWCHPEHGLLTPDQFIHLAEDTGLIGRLGLRLLEAACAQAASWQRAYPHAPFMSVNLSAYQLRNPGLVSDVVQVLDRTGLAADRLQLEITENAFVGGQDSAVQVLHDLADLGIRLAIDDFGTGYANLTYLRDLPVHGLKLAGSFVDCLRRPPAADPTGEAIISAVITLARTLLLTVTAEAVEDAYQASRLAAMGCDLGQGWYHGRPAPPAQIGRLLAGTA